MVVRHIKSKVPNLEDLDLDEKTLTQFANAKEGIVHICGATGSDRVQFYR